MKVLTFIFLLLFQNLWWGSNSFGGEVTVGGDIKMVTELGVSSAYLSGIHTYHISYYQGRSGVESELEFPLKTYLLGLEGRIYPEGKKWIFKFGVFKNIDNGSGRLKNSDWLSDDIDTYLYGIAHPGKDIYSELAIDLNALMYNVSFTYNILASKDFNLGPVGGFWHEDFRFKAGDVNQVGYGPYDRDYTIFIPGEALHYRIRYEFIYGGLDSEFSRANIIFGLKGGLGYVFARDRDDHLLRYKLAEAEADGLGAFFTLNTVYNPFKDLYLKASGQHLRFKTRGTQHQYFYRATQECPTGGCDSYVSDKIDSEQWIISLSIGYRFH